jgi:cysteinyl-tRNA synthetase
MDYGPDALEESKAVWDRFRAFLRVAPISDVSDDAIAAQLEPFANAMDDDLNTPAALAALHEIVRVGHSALERGENDIASESRAAVSKGLSLLGCEAGSDERSSLVGPLVELLLEQREQARAAKEFDRADEIRNRLTGIGVRVEDSSEGPRWFIA